MLIRAMMTRIDRENMIELSGMGVPIVVTCHASVNREPLPVDDRWNQPCGTRMRRVELDLSLMTMLDETQRRAR
jgi:hypothetical protein